MTATTHLRGNIITTLLAIALLAACGDANVALAQCTAGELAKLAAADPQSTDLTGYSVAVSGAVAVIGAYQDDDNGNNAGTAYVFTFEGSTWTLAAKLSASDALGGDYFGYAVAISGETVVVGAYGDDDHGSVSGSAYVFVKPPGGWEDMTQTAKLTASDGVSYDRFGSAVAVSADTVVVGAYLNDDAGTSSGSAYVYAKPAGGWVDAEQDAKLTASDAAAYDEFGQAVAISGNTVVIGAYADDDSGSSSGSAYVFEKPLDGWIDMADETAKLTASDGSINHYFARSVAIDGEAVLIGAPFDDETASNAGAAYLFDRPAGGWEDMTQTVKLLATDGAAYDELGRSVSLSGAIALIGAQNCDIEAEATEADAGAAYVYRYDGGSWVEDAKLVASDAAASDEFGFAVGVSGSIAVVGAYLDDIDTEEDAGSAYAFHGLSDCNTNTVLDLCDIVNGTSFDTDGNGVPDECVTAVLGDLDCSGGFDIDDVAPFVMVLVGEPPYADYYDLYPACNHLNGDMNGDQTVDGEDIYSFIDSLAM
ncbi:MAG: FG-GAP repeat protein [Planctomycetota bacterium]